MTEIMLKFRMRTNKQALQSTDCSVPSNRGNMWLSGKVFDL